VPGIIATDMASSAQPSPAAAKTALTVRRGLQRSGAMPIGIWAAAKAQNQAEDRTPGRAGSSAKSRAISGATTASAVRKSWLST
jgi:hypothetical protein